MAAVALLALCVGCGGPVLAGGAPDGSARDTDAPIVRPAGDAPSGWVDLASPWLGYSVSMPKAWGFTGHVPPADSRSPHDVFAGPVEGSDTTASLVVGRCATSQPTVIDGTTHEVVADGVSFRVAEVAGDEPGRTVFRATASVGGTTWYVMSCAGDDPASREFFDQVLGTFRFPAADFVEPVAASAAGRG